jgi:hypothetical protein
VGDGENFAGSNPHFRTTALALFGRCVVTALPDAEADRAFFRDVLGFKSVDAGHGWLIFALPPAEAAFHPSEAETTNSISCATTCRARWLRSRGRALSALGVC